MTAFRELEQLVRHLGDELSGFRRRALSAEARVRQLEQASAAPGATADELEALRRENAELRVRLDSAAERTRQLLDRVRFLRQQGTTEVER